MTSPKAGLYLADLTHTGQIVASNVTPLGIGLLAAYLLKSHPDLTVELFKYPSDLSEALQREIPPVVGFANYSWNLDLSYKYAQRIKAVAPSTVVVFGGPNYGLTEEEILGFWQRYPLIDFYVIKEGEVAFAELYRALTAHDFNVNDVKRLTPIPAHCHYLLDGHLTMGELLPRITDLRDIGSPYLIGLMDKFFDGVLIPMIHTTRGCPFTCTFCTEGSSYYNKVATRRDLKDELEYVAARHGTVADMTITDANFGMFTEDREKALAIADIQQRYNWPKRIIVSTGKNQKARVIEVASLLNGAMNIAASLQSTNDEVLANIRRSNISRDALHVIVEQSGKVDSVTYTELILGLPGDSYERHLQSLRDVTNAGLGIVRMFQLILLPQTEVNTPETRAQFRMQTKFRVNPRSFGKYLVLGQEIAAVEHEEILIAHATLSHEDYLRCRELDLTVEILHNAAMFLELFGLCVWLNYPWFDFLLRVHNRRNDGSPALKALHAQFVRDNDSGLFDSPEQLQAHVVANIEGYLADTEGTNEMAKAKAKAFFYLMDELHDVLYAEMQALVDDLGIKSQVLPLYLRELRRFSSLRKRDFIKTNLVFTSEFHFDFVGIRNDGFSGDPHGYYHDDPVEYAFYHNPDQKNTIRGYVGQYGQDSVESLGRILMRAPATKLFRDFKTGSHVYVNDAKQAMSLNVYGGFSAQ